METPPSSSTMGDATTSNPPAAGQLVAVEDDDGLPRSYYDVFARPDAAAYFEKLEQELYDDYIMKIAPKLRPIAADDSVKRFYKLCDTSGYYMGFRGLLHPEILCSMVSKNAIRCARAVLRGVAPEIRGFHVDPNARHRYGFAPLHMAAETFYVEMVQLLLRHGASANVRTQGTKVIEGLLPLNVAVENTSMHKYLEDNWEDGDPVENLIFLLCLPEMKMYLDTVRLMAKHTHNIVDELWNYIEKEKLVEASILLLAAQKQLRVQVNGSSGFDDVKSRTDGAAHTLHREGLAMVKEGKNGSALRKLKQKKEAVLTAATLIGIVNQAGEALEEYIEKFQTHSEVPHEEILEKVSSILNSKGIVPYGKGIDTGKLECYKTRLLMWREKLFPQKDTGATSEADKPSSLKPEVSKRVNGLALNMVRDKFFPYWKSVLSARMRVKLSSPCQLSNKDIKSAEASNPRTKGIKTTLRSGKDIESMKPISKDIQSAGLPWFASKFPGNPNLFGRLPLASNNEFKRQFCAAAAMSLKGLRRI